MKINQDIYSLAYAALVDPASQPSAPEYLKDINLSDNQVADLFMGCLMVIVVEFAVIGLVVNQW